MAGRGGARPKVKEGREGREKTCFEGRGGRGRACAKVEKCRRGRGRALHEGRGLGMPQSDGVGALGA